MNVMHRQNDLKFAVVAIGRNEGERLKRCLELLSAADTVVYVDSGSTDGSVQWARQYGVEVIELDISMPFSAARARNVGFRRARETVPDLAYVQFVDGDCELRSGWFEHVLSFMELHSDVGATAGRLRERCPERSIYNWLCDREWDRPVGEAHAVGGIAMMRASAVEAVGGYRDDVIAAEDDELCVRLRAAGWRIWRLGNEMALHDAAIMHFGQWWRRILRSGYGFALGVYLHGAPPERHFVSELRRAWLWGLWLPLACLAASVVYWPWGLMAWLIYPFQWLRQMARNPGAIGDRAALALFQLLARFPEALGQIKFTLDHFFGRGRRLIEYK